MQVCHSLISVFAEGGEYGWNSGALCRRYSLQDTLELCRKPTDVISEKSEKEIWKVEI